LEINNDIAHTKEEIGQTRQSIGQIKQKRKQEYSLRQENKLKMAHLISTLEKLKVKKLTLNECLYKLQQEKDKLRSNKVTQYGVLERQSKCNSINEMKQKYIDEFDSDFALKKRIREHKQKWLKRQEA